MNVIDIASRVMRDEAKALTDLIPLLDDNFTKAVELMMNCRGKVIVTGVGKSGHIGSKIAATLSSTGTPSVYVNPLDLYHGDLGVITSDDVVLAISNSGNTDELLRCIPMIQHANANIIGMSGNPASLLAKYATCHINVAVEKEACPLNLAPTSSTTATLAMGDALAIALMEERGFKPGDFAQYHPGGELGRRLLTTAADVMRSDDLPIVPQDMRLGEAIIRISAGHMGIGISLNNDSTLAGIITDGDLRRAIDRWQADFFNRTVSDIMTKNPKTVSPTTKITEIQKLLNDYQISHIVVLDDESRVLGIVNHNSCMV